EVLRGAVQAALAHPRQPVKPEDLALPRMLPPEPRPVVPLITFRTLNGYKHWDAPLPAGEEETTTLRVRRGFEVQAPDGETRRCVVEICTSVRELIREETGHDYAPTDELWDTVCRMALADYLWTRAQLPPETLTIYELSRKQLEVVRSLAGL